jgi:hypothetical protein
VRPSRVRAAIVEWYANRVGVRLPLGRLPVRSLLDAGGEPPQASPEREGARWDQIWAENWPWIIVVSIVAVELSWLVQADPVVRGPLVLWFSLVCTGMAWVRLLRIGEPLAEAVVAIALSVALSGLTAAAFLYAGHWSPGWTLVVLEAITLAGVILDRFINGTA